MSSTAAIKKAIAENAEKRAVQHGKRLALLTARIGAVQKISIALDDLKESLADRKTTGASKVIADTVALRKCTATLDRLLHTAKNSKQGSCIFNDGNGFMNNEEYHFIFLRCKKN